MHVDAIPRVHNLRARGLVHRGGARHVERARGGVERTGRRRGTRRVTLGQVARVSRALAIYSRAEQVRNAYTAAAAEGRVTRVGKDFSVHYIYVCVVCMSSVRYFTWEAFEVRGSVERRGGGLARMESQWGEVVYLGFKVEG